MKFLKHLIESTAFGSLIIIDQIEKYGVIINEIVAIGGLSKSNLIMQIYSDITGRKIKVLKSDQVCAVGSAILASCKNKGAYKNQRFKRNTKKHVCKS